MSLTKITEDMIDMALPETDEANVFIATQQIKSTDAGATAGPTLELYRDSASPAAADDIGQIAFQGEDSAGNLENYARLKAVIVDPTSTSEDAKLVMQTVVAGTLAARFNVGGGLWSEGVTGGDPGAGKINVTELQLAGVAQTPRFNKSYTSAAQTITAGGSLTLAHSLGAMPTLLQMRLKCVTGEHGYSAGDEVLAWNGDANAGRGASVVPDATNINIRYGNDANTFNVNNKTTGASAAITNANWSMIIRAWA